MTPQDLQNSVLQRAIQGKLVEQRPEEGTGEELYRRIQAEKRRLIQSGKLKKEKPLPEISEDEIPFDIPDSWTWCRLSSLTYPVGNKYNQILAKDVKKSGKYPAISQGSSLIDGYCDEGDKAIFDLPLIMFGDHTRNVKYIDFPFVISADGTKFLKAVLVNPKYFFYWVSIIANQLHNRGYARHFTLLKKELVPLPPLAEQKRIIAKIEELSPYLDRYAAAWERLKAFNQRFPSDMRKSLLQMAIQGKLAEQRPEEGTGEELYRQIQAEKQRLIKSGKLKKEKSLPETADDEIPFEIPDSWKWVSIGAVCVNIQYGTSKKSSVSGKVAVLRMGNLREGQVEYTNLVYTSDEADILRYSLNKNDLLFNRTNSKELVGKTAIYKAEIPAIYAGYLIRVTPVFVDGDYLNYVMQSYYFWDYCQRVKSDAIGQSNINAEKLKAFYFPLPPLAEQKRIVARLEELLPLCVLLK